MKTQIAFKNSSGKEETRTFEFVHSTELSFSERMEYISDGFDSIDWTDEDMHEVEKQAAAQVGIQPGERVLVKFH